MYLDLSFLLIDLAPPILKLVSPNLEQELSEPVPRQQDSHVCSTELRGIVESHAGWH
jgi:hypothetical protein